MDICIHRSRDSVFCCAWSNTGLAVVDEDGIFVERSAFGSFWLVEEDAAYTTLHSHVKEGGG